MKRAYALLSFLFLSFAVIGQEEVTFRQNFIEGNQLMEEYSYDIALEIWVDVLKSNPDNANINYKTGVCLWKLPKRRQEALPYFQKAVKNVSDRYDPFSPAEEGAPIETYFYIANSYHLDYALDSAIIYYQKFKNQINHNHEFWARTDLEIAMCERAKEAVLNPVDIKIINLGELVNTKYADYAPTISVDESALYFTSKRLRKDSSNLYSVNDADGQYYEDIYVTYRGDDYAWGEPEQVNFNTSDNESTLSLSADGETMYIYKNGKSGYGDIYQSKLDGLVWSDPEPVGSDINSEDHETHASVTPDGRRLYYISNKKGSLRFPDKAHEKVYSKDIYFCNLLPTGDWALSQPVKELNTPYHEDGVFIHPDGKTMYFSSEGHSSIGGYDIFVSKLGEDSVWGKPENIGYPINTTDDDVFFITSTSGKRGYYSSIRDKGYGEKDLYVISMLSFEENPLTLLIGQITAADGSEIPNDIFIYVTDNETGEEIGTFKPRARDHKFTIIIPPGSDYHLEYTYNDSIFYKDDIFVPENSAYQEIEKEVGLGSIDFSGIQKTQEEQIAAAPKATAGPKSPNVEGKLLYGEAGAAGVALLLQDANEKTIQTTTTDGSGNFVFRNLEAGSKYYVAIDPAQGSAPDNAQVYMKDSQTGAMLPVAKTASGKFAFETLPYMDAEELELMNEEEADPSKPAVNGNLTYGGAAAAGVVMNLNDKNNNKVSSTKTDNNGDFAFNNLEAGSKYAIAIDPSNGTIPENAQVTLNDKATGKSLAVSKMADGTFAFETLPMMKAEDLKPVEAKEEKVAVKEKTLPPAYKTQVKEVDGEKYIIHEVKEGETMFSVSVLYNLKFPVVQDANPNMGDLIYPGDQILLPIPAEVMFYQEFFDYNIASIQVSEQDYKNFVAQVEKVVTENGKATLMIESSSSKVPSTKLGGNKNLSIKRAENAKAMLIQSMSEKSIGTDKLNFSDMSTLIRGPEYQNDAQENRATYKNYQYVKIIVK